jgi:hypothetical protein
LKGIDGGKSETFNSLGACVTRILSPTNDKPSQTQRWARLLVNPASGAQGAVPVQADGQVIGETPVVFAVQAHALMVLAPPEPASE